MQNLGGLDNFFFLFIFKNDFVRLTALTQSVSITREASLLFHPFLLVRCLLNAIKHFTLVEVPVIH